METRDQKARRRPYETADAAVRAVMPPGYPVPSRLPWRLLMAVEQIRREWAQADAA